MFDKSFTTEDKITEDIKQSASILLFLVSQLFLKNLKEHKEIQIRHFVYAYALKSKSGLLLRGLDLLFSVGQFSASMHGSMHQYIVIDCHG